MNCSDLFEESPHGYSITAHAPQEVDKAISYYLTVLEKYTLVDYPVEHGVANYALARILFIDRNTSPRDEDRAKRIENSLFYFNQALETFDYREYPMMYALISIYMGRLYRERSLLINSRSFLAERSTPAQSLQFGIDQAVEALPLYTANRSFPAELAICCLELGHLVTLLLDIPEYCEDSSLREQGIGYLERAISIAKDVKAFITYKEESGKTVRWQPSDPSTFPQHIKLLLDGYSFRYIEGVATYLLGRIEEGWQFHGADLSPEEVKSHREHAYRYYSVCCKPRLLPPESGYWADAHHRLALLIIKFPALVDGDFEVDDNGLPMTDLYLDAAISHLTLAQRSAGLKRSEKMDVHFHRAQAQIFKLQLIIDRVPYGESVTKAIVFRDGLELIQNIETDLREALKRVTAANTQSAQDAFVYYYSSLKLAEYRMLQAACASDITVEEREEYLRDAVQHMVEACASRPLPDNMDLHYVASVQLAQMLAAVKRSHAASKAFAKTLLVLSALANRAVFNPAFFELKLLDDLNKHSTQAVSAAVREIEWVKLHLGPKVLHERVAAGYASWSFEDLPRAKPHKDKKELALVEDEDSGKMAATARLAKATPPKTVPPLQLPVLNRKKVYVSGEEIMEEDELKKGFLPPEGPVPLYAMGQNPVPLVRQGSSSGSMQDNSATTASCEEPRYAQSPYMHRMRSRVPPLMQMKEIEKANRVAFGLPKGGKIAHLLPSVHGSKDYNAQPSASQKGESPPSMQLV
jgi:hypothetical protein